MVRLVRFVHGSHRSGAEVGAAASEPRESSQNPKGLRVPTSSATNKLGRASQLPALACRRGTLHAAF